MERAALLERRIFDNGDRTRNESLPDAVLLQCVVNRLDSTKANNAFFFLKTNINQNIRNSCFLYTGKKI